MAEKRDIKGKKESEAERIKDGAAREEGNNS
jgi:hypothetical protein